MDVPIDVPSMSPRRPPHVPTDVPSMSPPCPHDVPIDVPMDVPSMSPWMSPLTSPPCPPMSPPCLPTSPCPRSAVVPAHVDALPVELGGAEAAHEEMRQVRGGDDARATASATNCHLVGLRQRFVICVGTSSGSMAPSHVPPCHHGGLGTPNGSMAPSDVTPCHHIGLGTPSGSMAPPDVTPMSPHRTGDTQWVNGTT